MSQDDFQIVELWADLCSQLTRVSQVLGGATALPKVVLKHPSGASVKRLLDIAETAEQSRRDAVARPLVHAWDRSEPVHRATLVRGEVV